MTENKIKEFKLALSGRFVATRVKLDIIHRVSSVVLVRDDGSDAVLRNNMVDIDENAESGELIIDSEPADLNYDVTLHFDFADSGVYFAHAWVIETQEIGRIVSGLALCDDSGRFVEIFAAAEVCCLYMRMPGIQSSSEPEYETTEYLKV